MEMKTSPNDVSNADILIELKQLHASDQRIQEELQKLSATDLEIREELASLHESDSEILEALGTFAEKVDERFDKIESDANKLQATVVTKGYLDDKLADFHSDIIQHTRKEIEKAMR